jgi:hypothetical protein
MTRYILTIARKLQPILARQPLHELLIRLRLLPTQLVIEMNNRQDDSQLRAQLQKRPQKRNRINPPRHSHAHPIARTQQLLRSNVR